MRSRLSRTLYKLAGASEKLLQRPKSTKCPRPFMPWNDEEAKYGPDQKNEPRDCREKSRRAFYTGEGGKAGQLGSRTFRSGLRQAAQDAGGPFLSTHPYQNI
eukprot:6990628-Pyramimonas_sp.AAC.1